MQRSRPASTPTPTNSWSTGTCPRRWARCAWSPAPRACAGHGSPTKALLPSSEGWLRDESNPILEQGRRELEEWFAKDRRAFEVALDPVGTPFQHEVWRALCALDFGVLTSYGELARTVGRPKGAQAIGGAVGRNPLIIIIPCHRVIGSDTSLTGFGGGLPRKQALLAHEGNLYVSRSPRARRVCDGQAELPW